MAVGPIIGHADVINCVTFSPDGAYIASASDDCAVRLWSAFDGTLALGPLYGHTRFTTSVAFSPDSTHLASCSVDHSIRIWDIRKHQQSTFDPHYSARPPSLPITNQPAATALSDWVVRGDGWIINEDHSFLFWVPSELRRSLLTPWCANIISRSGTVEVDMSEALLGQRWHECYVSE